jgi:alpha-amylase
MKHLTDFTKALRLFFLFLFFGILTAGAQSRIERTVFQGFWWNYWNNNFPNSWANYLTELAPRLKAAGFDAIWLPPVYKNASTGYVGYGPFDEYDLGDKYQKGGGDSLNVRTRVGTKDELLRLIAVMHANGIEVIEDVVLNHNDGAGANNGDGGQDPETSFSTRSNSGYKNFRYTSFATPLLDDSQADYWTRSGRWAKNYPNYHPTLTHDCLDGDICGPFFGPDICYQPGAYGQSSNIPTTGNAMIGSITRAYYNPAQSGSYMRDQGRNWIEWFKKQTGSDGWRWDAVKHFETAVQEDYIYNTKYSLPTWSAGGQNMFCVAELIGTASEMDTYVNAVKTGSAPNGVTDEKHTGTFDFSMRGYGPNGGIYSMVLGQGGYNIANLPGEQQGERYMDYPDGHRVYRTVPFVNSHDTYRPILTSSGDFSKPLGDASGWDTGNELGGNGQHIDPREPRLAAAYAAISAVDGNPVFYFEDLFDIGTTGKRYTHLPSNETDLPLRGDLQNILHAHQKLAFKDGNYAVPTTLADDYKPYFQKGNSGDHIVFERTGKAIIGVTDAYNSGNDNANDQEVYISCSFPIGTVLYDYSGAHGVATVTVSDNFGDQNNHRVLIKTAPVGHTITGAYGHGYSIWAPAPPGVTVTSVQDLYNYLATYSQPLAAQTTQEWEMADDLGDSHCKSLGQGGALPSNSTNQRVAGKIYTDANKSITYKVFPEVDGRNITVSLWDLDGHKLSEAQGVANGGDSPLQGTYTATTEGWIIVKVRNTVNTQAGQKVWVNVTYTAPKVVNTRLDANKPETRVAIWTGNGGTNNVFDCGNWEEGKIPNAGVDMIVPGYASPSPVISANFSVKNLIVDNGINLTIDGATVKISGTISNAGTIDASTATIELNGSVPQSIPANSFVGNTVKALTVNNSAGVSLLGPLSLTDVLTPAAGTLTTNGFLTLRSTAAGTARVAPGVASGGYITGAVTVERFIPDDGHRAWRLLAIPTTGSQTMYEAWQDTAKNHAGYGTLITSNLYNGSNGFDMASNSSSILQHNQGGLSGPSWSALTATTGVLSPSANTAYMLFVRGDRTATPSNATHPATTLRSTGGLNQGTLPAVTVSADGTGYTLLANPFASPIDFENIASTPNLNPSFLVWDANLAGTYGVGGFRLVERTNAGAYQQTPQVAGGPVTDNSLRYIHAGQAFFLKATGADASIILTEDSKATGTSVLNPFRMMTTEQQLLANLFIVNGVDTVLADGLRARFNNAYTASVTGEDVLKMANFSSENLGLKRDGQLLMVEKRPEPVSTDTLYLNLSGAKPRAYRLQFQGINMSPQLTAELVDAYRNTKTPLDLGSTTAIDFTVDNAAASSAADRFRIVFRAAGILPLTLQSIRAYQQDRNIVVEWKVQNETGISHYEVEKSVNGTAFGRIGTQKATGSANGAVVYTWLDGNVPMGANYYRIRSLSQNGQAAYSPVVKLVIGEIRAAWQVYPNPVTSASFNLQFSNQPGGLYTLRLLNAAGQEVLRRQITHGQGTSTESVELSPLLPAGNYTLEIIAPDAAKHTVNIIHQ